MDTRNVGNSTILEFIPEDRKTKAVLEFNGTDFIVDKPLEVDSIKEKTAAAGVTIDGVVLKDGTITTGLGTTATPVSRTNNPIVGANLPNVNIDVLDAAIGADATPVARTTGPIAVANTVNQNLDALDAAIGFEGQMSGTPNVVTFPTTIFQALDKLDTYKTVQTVKKTIGAPGLGSMDFNFTSVANQTEQVINLGAIVPAKARILDAMTYTDAVFTNAVSLVAETGTTSSGNQLIGSATIMAAGAITASANGGTFIATPSGSATNIYVSATPGANWDVVGAAGSISVYITFINLDHV